MAQYTYNKFIPMNKSPKGAEYISVFDSDHNLVGEIPLGSLTNPATEDEPIYKFGLLSDIHVDSTDYNYSELMNTYSFSDEGEGDFRRALTWLTTRDNVDMICACGDMSQNGTTSEFAMPQAVINEVLPTSKNIPFYTCTGNHDVKTAGGNGFGNYFLRNLETTWNGMTNFQRSSAFNESFCFDKQCGDKTDHFIFFSMYSYSLGSSASPYLDTDITWLSNKLSTWRNDRVFIFTHLFFPDYAGNLGRINGQGGIYPSGNWLGGTQLTTLTNLLNTYKNAIWFSGHSHWKWDLQKYQNNVNVERIGSDGAWTVHVPSCALPIDSDYSTTNQQTANSRREKPLESQGSVVYVYSDRIEIRGIDFNISTSQDNSTVQGSTDTTYTRYLPIANYVLSAEPNDINIPDPIQPGDPIKGYYIVTSNSKATGEKIELINDYVVLTYNALSQCVCITNDTLTAEGECSVSADEIIIEYDGQEIALANVANFGVYMQFASEAGGVEYASLVDITGGGITGASVQTFTAVDSNNENSQQRFGAQLNISSRFLTGNTWCTEISTAHPLTVKVKGLKINGQIVNNQTGTSGGGETEETVTMTPYTYQQLTNMAANSEIDVIMANPHKNNGYIIGHNGSSASNLGNGFAAEQDMMTKAGEAVGNDTYTMILRKTQSTVTEPVYEDRARTFTIAEGGSVTISKQTSSISGYDLYRATLTRNGTRQVNISFDGTLPQYVYLKAYKSSRNATYTVSLTGGTGEVTSSTNNTTTSLTNFTRVTQNDATMNVSCTINNTSGTYYLYILVPNNITEQVQVGTQEVPYGDAYYTIKSKNGGYGPTGTNAAASWSTDLMHYTLVNPDSLASSTDLTSGINATNNINLIRFVNPSNNYLNAGGGIGSLKFANGTGEWSVWYLYDPNSKTTTGGRTGDYLQKAHFETNTNKGSLSPDTYIQDLPNGYVAVSLNAVSQGFWVSPPNMKANVQPTLQVDDLKVYSGNMVTSGTTIELPQYIGFYGGTNYSSGADRYQIVTGFTPSYTESNSNGRLQFQTSSSYTGGAITVVMKAKLIYA